MTKRPNPNCDYELFRDGDTWCAVGPKFTDLQNSTEGWGDTAEEAYRDWCTRVMATLAWADQPLPLFRDFVVVVHKA